MPSLIRPNVKYKKSFIEAVYEFHQEGENKKFKISELENDFKGFVKKLLDKEKGIGLKKGYLPESVYWLVEGGEYIGRISLRHRYKKPIRTQDHIGYEIRPSKRGKGYGTKILKLALPKFWKLKIPRARITCFDDNLASIKIIEKNGGVLQDKIKFKGKLLRRYSIDKKI